MNLHTPEITWPPKTQSGGERFVGAALITLPELATTLAGSLFAASIRLGLSRASIEPELLGAIAGDSFLCCVAQVPETKPALRAIHQVAQEMGWTGVLRIGFFDADEGIWRTVSQQRDSFETFLTAEQFEIHNQKAAAVTARLKAIISSLEP